MFELQETRHEYEGRVALARLDWSVEQGGQRLLFGPSGCGKTTLLHILAGLLRPTAGTVRVAGSDLGRLSPAAIDRFRGRTIGIVFQRLHLIGALSVLDNLLLAQYLAGLRQDRMRVALVLDSLGIAGRRDAYPHQLSHGQAQRVAIARAVVNRPRVILADEPTSNLDDDNAAQVLDLLTGQAAAAGATLVIATHDQRVRSRVPQCLELHAPADG